MRRYFPFVSFAQPRHANPLLFGALLFALGVAAGGWLRPATMAHGATPAVATAPVGIAGTSSSAAADIPLAHRLDPNIVYPAELIRVIDGDTFEARVRVWPGLDVDTKVRLRGVDAAELHARCDSELAQAQAARTALQQMLDEGGVTISRVGVDKYGGRVDATIATRGTADVSAALLKGGFARAYDGGKRGSWCG
ncbi:MAG TPA: thermonuclease family protein [Xanthobacteraceae bacterium]|nr:thermonuclease family protein [Xanthobacteraceae bacterium]